MREMESVDIIERREECLGKLHDVEYSRDKLEQQTKNISRAYVKSLPKFMKRVLDQLAESSSSSSSTFMSKEKSSSTSSSAFMSKQSSSSSSSGS